METTYDHLTTVPVSASAQTTFVWDWTPTRDDIGENTLYAFVKTSMPVIELELSADSSRKVTVESICLALRAPGSWESTLTAATTGDCTVSGTMRHVRATVSAVGTTTETTVATVTLTEDPALAGPGIRTFRPTGTFSFTRTGTVAGCTLSVATTTGALTGPSSGALTLYGGDADHVANLYAGTMGTGPFNAVQIITWPDSSQTVTLPFDEPLVSVSESQGLVADPGTRTAQGSYSSEGETWEWNLVFQPQVP